MAPWNIMEKIILSGEQVAEGVSTRINASFIGT
jgi:hypothetical protein